MAAYVRARQEQHTRLRRLLPLSGATLCRCLCFLALRHLLNFHAPFLFLHFTSGGSGDLLSVARLLLFLLLFFFLLYLLLLCIFFICFFRFLGRRFICAPLLTESRGEMRSSQSGEHELILRTINEYEK